MPLERFKSPADWSAAEHLHHQRDPDFQPESDEYVALRHKTLVAAGLESDDDETTEVASMTPEQHLMRIRAEKEFR